VASRDREKWDGRWRARGAPGAPSPVLASLDAVLPRAGAALDVAGGAGRHALWLARRGLAVTLVDISPEALRLAAEAAAAAGLSLETLEVDLEAAPPPPGPFDAIVCFHFLDRRVYAALPSRLAPGGVLVVVHPTRLNLTRHPSPGPAHLVLPGELPTLFPGLEPLRVEEGWLDEGRHEARIVARRAPEPPAGVRRGG
jgi:SAM-dependent methyltransferase